VGPYTALEVALSNAVIGLGGIMIGRLFTESAKRSKKICDQFRAACQGEWSMRFDEVERRLDRIEGKLDRMNGK